MMERDNHASLHFSYCQETECATHWQDKKQHNWFPEEGNVGRRQYNPLHISGGNDFITFDEPNTPNIGEPKEEEDRFWDATSEPEGYTLCMTEREELNCESAMGNVFDEEPPAYEDWEHLTQPEPSNWHFDSYEEPEELIPETDSGTLEVEATDSDEWEEE
jgi:hypothetical protein